MIERNRIMKEEEEEEVKPFKDEAIDDLWSEIRDDDKSIEMPQVEKGQITLMPTTSKVVVERNEVGQMTSKTTTTKTPTQDVEAIPLVRMTHKSEVREEEKQIKVSTACGQSPDREIEQVFANEANEKPINVTREIPARSSSKVSIGTSPPPQNISTQVKP